MKIAIVSTNFYPTPPNKKTISAPLWLTKTLTERLSKRGHDVTFFGASDSTIKTKVASNTPSLKKNKDWDKPYKFLEEKASELLDKKSSQTLLAQEWQTILRENYQLRLATYFCKKAEEENFDIIHFHTPFTFLHFASFVDTPIVMTIHDPLTYPLKSNSLKVICKLFSEEVNFITISEAQRKPAPSLNYLATVPNGIEIDKFNFSKKGKGYLAFAGRLTPEKGAHTAIKVAKELDKPLKIAGKIYPQYKDYWEKEIKPNLSEKIEYLGLLPREKMSNFYKNADALLMPIEREEPFGLVMIEAMACGTPVVAFNKGAVPEVIKNNETGFIVKNPKEMIKATQNIEKIKRKDCREHVENNFSTEKMVDNYLKTYKKIVN